VRVNSIVSAIVAVIALSTSGGAAHAVVVAGWTFETSAPAATNSATIGGIAAEVGTGTASGVHASAATDYSNPVGNGSAESFSSNEWAIGDYYQFSFSTSGLSSVSLSWDQARSSTGPATFDLTYSINGGSTFLTLSDNYSVAISGSGGPGTWSSGTALAGYSFNVPAGVLDNVSSVLVRLVADSAPGGTSGSNRVDNFVVSAVPEASSFLFGGLALCAAGAPAIRRRWKARKA
jgi:hypothetical protein